MAQLEQERPFRFENGDARQVQIVDYH